MDSLKDQVALVTGAGREGGIGAAVARRLAQAGAHVALSDLCAPPTDLPNGGNGQWEGLEAVAREVEACGVRSLALRGDVSDAASVQSMVDEVDAAFGRLDILVNNAGVAVAPAPVVAMEEAAWRRTLEVNATGTFLCCKHALPLMIEGGRGGRIVNMASLAADRPRIYASAYAASKAAVVALTRALALEVAEFGITVNAVLPGDIDTAFKQWSLELEAMIRGHSTEQVTAALVARIPVGRMGTPEDVAHAVAFLASREAGFVTGQAYVLSGGREWT